MTTDYDCNCIHETMPGLCCEVPESYAHFTACELICERKSKLFKKKKKKRECLDSKFCILEIKKLFKRSLFFCSMFMCVSLTFVAVKM